MGKWGSGPSWRGGEALRNNGRADCRSCTAQRCVLKQNESKGFGQVVRYGRLCILYGGEVVSETKYREIPFCALKNNCMFLRDKSVGKSGPLGNADGWDARKHQATIEVKFDAEWSPQVGYIPGDLKVEEIMVPLPKNIVRQIDQIIKNASGNIAKRR